MKKIFLYLFLFLSFVSCSKTSSKEENVSKAIKENKKTIVKKENSEKTLEESTYEILKKSKLKNKRITLKSQTDEKDKFSDELYKKLDLVLKKNSNELEYTVLDNIKIKEIMKEKKLELAGIKFPTDTKIPEIKTPDTFLIYEYQLFQKKIRLFLKVLDLETGELISVGDLLIKRAYGE